MAILSSSKVGEDFPDFFPKKEGDGEREPAVASLYDGRPSDAFKEATFSGGNEELVDVSAMVLRSLDMVN